MNEDYQLVRKSEKNAQAEKKTYSAKEIVQILEAGRNYGVRQLDLGDLKVEFFESYQPGFARELHTKPFASPEKAAKLQEEVSEETLVQEELDFRDEQLELAKLQDPMLYEEMIMGKELDDAKA